jgi:2'-5' RNA ligase
MNILNYHDFIKSCISQAEKNSSSVSITKITHTLSEKKKEEKPKYDYGCVMVYFDFPEMEELHSLIDPSDLQEEGSVKSLEKDPHVTLLYGLHSDEISDDDVMKAVDKSIIKDLVLHKISAFNNEKFDVLKFDVKGEGLAENNENLKKFPYTTDYPDYHPHATVAYLKPGTADKYIKMLKDKEYEVTPSLLVYSKPGDDESKNKITEKFQS